jgi:hypothetical protein
MTFQPNHFNPKIRETFLVESKEMLLKRKTGGTKQREGQRDEQCVRTFGTTIAGLKGIKGLFNADGFLKPRMIFCQQLVRKQGPQVYNT